MNAIGSCTRQDLSGLKDRFWRPDQTEGLREKSAVAETECQLVQGGRRYKLLQGARSHLQLTQVSCTYVTDCLLPKLPKVLTAKLTPFSTFGDECT